MECTIEYLENNPQSSCVGQKLCQWEKTKSFLAVVIVSNFQRSPKGNESQSGTGLNNQLQRIRGKPFWYWDKTRHKKRDRITKGECCFNHILGPPKKDGVEKPFFYDYEHQIYRGLLHCLGSMIFNCTSDIGYYRQGLWLPSIF
jgi:hypothetical protein